MISKQKGIILDYDGVIAESNHIKTDAFRELFKKEKIKKLITHDKIKMKIKDFKSLYFCLIQFNLGPIAIIIKNGMIIGAITEL